MGHRTLVAYDRDGYDVHYAHWGIDRDAITADNPFGGPPDNEWARNRATELLDPAGGELTADRKTAVNPDPIATNCSFADVCAHLDPLEHEALYVVGPEFSIRAFLVFAIEAGGTRPAVALVGYDGAADAAYLRGWLAGARSVRDVCAVNGDAIVRALRWLDPQRGTVVWAAGERDA
ncbi:MAG: hypothetical protein ACI8UR_000647 [Natronomonas sp.]|jgi:hypothetical protein|uniref:DUF6735 family protein n=1 Tax=Natronomonas sp. TaxID=2184060 RepID=UPI003988EA15